MTQVSIAIATCLAMERACVLHLERATGGGTTHEARKFWRLAP